MVQIVGFSALKQIKLIFKVADVDGFAVHHLRSRINFFDKFCDGFSGLVGYCFLSIDKVVEVVVGQRVRASEAVVSFGGDKVFVAQQFPKVLLIAEPLRQRVFIAFCGVFAPKHQHFVVQTVVFDIATRQNVVNVVQIGV